MTKDPLDRRTAVRLVGVSVVGAAGLALSGCGADQGESASSSAAAGTQTASGAGQLISPAEIPVGGGKVFPKLDVVLTQPTQGTFEAFSATCTHAGCTVGSVKDGLITCPCHGSQFDAATGAVRRGPAEKALPKKSVTVSADGLSVS